MVIQFIAETRLARGKTAQQDQASDRRHHRPAKNPVRPAIAISIGRLSAQSAQRGAAGKDQHGGAEHPGALRKRSAIQPLTGNKDGEAQ